MNTLLLKVLNVILIITCMFMFMACPKSKDPIPSPVAKFAYYEPLTSFEVPTTIVFLNESKNADTYLWAYPGGTSTRENLTLTFNTAGSYTITLKATGNGKSDTYSMTIKLTAPTASNSPTAAFTYSPNQNLMAPAKITFTNTSQNADSYKWDFGDGSASTDINPLKEFTKAGTYQVKLTASNKNSYAIYSVPIEINTLPVDTGIELPSVDKAVSNFMAKYNLPGVSIALVKEDRLVYAKAYGLANKATNTALRTSHLFRLASVSKSITSVAVFKLIEAGKLSLDAKVFGQNGLLGTTYGTQPYGKNIETITVRHLLQHTAGGWNNTTNDPMFYPDWLGYSQNQLISIVLNSRPLASTPGSVYDYSNFGYLVLGRIIEKLSEKSYEEYVKETILKPAGITVMAIGGDTESERLTNEVTYYDTGFSPYAMKIRRMDAHGGWVASAPDLARLLVRVNGFSNKTDLLTFLSINQMITPSTANSNYACGWSVNAANNWWHQGSLPGTATMWARVNSNIGWVILVNQRSNDPNFSSDLDALMWNGIQGISQWPTQDLF